MQNNFIYIKTEMIQNFVTSKGVSPADFINGVPSVPHNLILLNDDYRHANGLNVHTKFSVIQGLGAVKNYLLDSRVRDKRVIDFYDQSDLDELLDREIADLLYFSHMGSPLYGAFSNKLHNQYVYFALKSRFSKVYYRNFRNFGWVLNTSIKRHFRKLVNGRRLSFGPANVFEHLGRNSRSKFLIRNLPESIIKRLVQKSAVGVIMAFDHTRISKHRRIFEVPILVKTSLNSQSTWTSESNFYRETENIGHLVYNASRQIWHLSVSVR